MYVWSKCDNLKLVPWLCPQLEKHLWEAFDHVLYHIYHVKLPEGLSFSDMLAVAQVADRCQVPSCLDNVKQRFSTTQPEDLSWHDVSTFYSMADTLREGVLAAAREPFAETLIARFKAFEEAWREDDLRAAFLDLPQAAVEVLAASDKLQVVSENTVATALASWVAHDAKHRGAAALRLAQHIRLQHLTQAYVAHVLLKLPHIGQHISAQRLAAALQRAKTCPVVRVRIKLDAEPARAAMPAGFENEFSWQLPTRDVLQLVETLLEGAKAGGIGSPLFHYNGFQLQMWFQAGISTTKQVPCLWLWLSVYGCPQLGKLVQVQYVDVAGSILMPASQGHRNVFTPSTFRVGRTAGLGAKALCCGARTIALGAGAVHDEQTLLAALGHPASEPSGPFTTPAAPRQYLELTCRVTRCE